MDRLTSMSAFVMAAESGSYARAAERLGMSPQMVAKHVAALEHRLGARLLNRTTRRQSLTELGSAYYERCKHIVSEAQAADSLAQIMNDTPRGKLKISAPVTFGSYSLMPFMTDFLRQHPEVEIDLHLTDRFVDLVEEGYEVAFRIGPLANSSLTARPLAPYRLVACAAPSYLMERGTPQTPADLENHECLGYAYWSRPADREWQFCKGSTVHKVQVTSRLQVNESKALLSAALDGFGIVLGPEDFLQPALQSGELVRLLTDFEAPSRHMHLLYTANRQRTAKLRRFIDAALVRFGAN
ncbi:LysR family transcriptional regulator [Pseudomonas sp. FW306-02-F02-AA]|uniref:LysR family transcriptional regulator n=1 Tax=Pseudomonas fluorescens TaxID=294 RepID=A0A0N9WR18_PSEFL|nr:MULTISPECIES: LysR family transcriptional regulator [Pseudomonas]ALI05145.1 LysR family transcriptional regulator [Pseudomonas fluorescens]PMZ03078.1 LysR family transcriptional regulator [Pseudomonas sp. FW306-02-F02-AB]PMZ12134.1 LysR family transcriptional regulator [Pseudomonas sp. FW306-02-H06C]PMZ14487.1 LysR family transcriptional regulator [Pseudomonas sp. FW306-02-F02-AA]PMZ20528.1 LysR family transcriptional regulator [Pseudomonas sp. FW306-02-F08-AA]